MRLMFAFVLLVSMSACHSSNKKIIGYWKMEEVSINGATLTFDQIGKPFYTFDEKGNYVLDMNNQLEKGKYSIEEQTISLATVLAKKPKQDFRFELKDSTELIFIFNSAKNRMTIKLSKQKDKHQSSI